MRRIISRNPFTAQINAEFDFISQPDLTTKIERAATAYELHRKRTIKQRGDMIASLGEVIAKNKNKIGQLITEEMGKPISQSQMEVDKVVSFCRHYSTHFNDILPTQIKTDAKVKTLIKYFPIGTLYFIVPFNFPFFLAFKGLLPNLLLGNVCLARNSDCNPLLGQFIEELMNEAGFDSGQYQNVFTSPDQLDFILSQNSVAGVSFTGSSRTGASIASCAGKYLKKSVMELGGNDPFVVLQDADLDLAVNDAYIGRSRNAGQICFSPKRFIVVEQLYESFKKKLIEKLAAAKYGDPSDPSVEIGPLARDDLYTNLESQLASLPKSWKLSWQREDIKRPFFPLTVYDASDEVFDEELFGPIFPLFKAKNEEHAVELANSGTYGLGASVYSKTRGEDVVERIRAGMGFVNTFTKSDYSFPTGGIGRSGYGRECGVEGARSFANVRVQYVN